MRNLHEDAYGMSNEKQAGAILLMDDDRYFSLLMAEILKDCGFSVSVTRNGEEALSLYARRMGSEPFDAVILDIFVKNGMGAADTLAKLLELDPNVTAVVSSGNHEHSLMENYRSFGFKAALPKPYGHADAMKAILQAIHSMERGDPK